MSDTVTSTNEQTITANHQATPLDEPPPAYEVTPTSNNSENVINVLTIEAPPPYCLVDPSKLPRTDHIVHHPHITPVEIININVNNNHRNAQSSGRRPVIATWLVSGSNMDIGTDCTFLMAFVIAFFFNWLGFLAVICLIPTIAARFGAMSGFGLSVAKWITVMRYHEYNNSLYMHGRMSTNLHDPTQNFVFAIVLFAGFFLFIRGLMSYISVKNRTHQQGQTTEVFTWY